jgi:hypothetical protein
MDALCTQSLDGNDQTREPAGVDRQALPRALGHVRRSSITPATGGLRGFFRPSPQKRRFSNDGPGGGGLRQPTESDSSARKCLVYGCVNQP